MTTPETLLDKAEDARIEERNGSTGIVLDGTLDTRDGYLFCRYSSFPFDPNPRTPIIVFQFVVEDNEEMRKRLSPLNGSTWGERNPVKAKLTIETE